MWQVLIDSLDEWKIIVCSGPTDLYRAGAWCRNINDIFRRVWMDFQEGQLVRKNPILSIIIIIITFV